MSLTTARLVAALVLLSVSVSPLGSRAAPLPRPPGETTGLVASESVLLAATDVGLFYLSAGSGHRSDGAHREVRPPSGIGAEPARWERIDAAGQVAIDRNASGRFVAAGREVITGEIESIGRPDAAPGSALVRIPLPAGAEVRDVALGSRGEIWVATDVGLLHAPSLASAFEPAGLPERDVHGVVVMGGAVFASTPGAIWRGRREVGFARIVTGQSDDWWELRGAALRERGAPGERLAPGEPGAPRDPGGRRGGSGEPGEGVDGAEVVLGVPGGLWISGPERARRVAWRERPIRELLHVGDRVVVATPRGVYFAALSDPARGRRVGPSAVALAVRPLVDPDGLAGEAAGRVLAVGREGVVGIDDPRREVAPALPARSVAVERAAANVDRRVVALHRAALRHLGLEPRWGARLAADAARRGRRPEIRLSFHADHDRSREFDHDQAFTGGALRDLFDTRHDRASGGGVELELRWDLDAPRDPADRIAISRERRERVELREQLLERINRAYFERRRVEVQLVGPDLGESERAELRIRFMELTAELDAFTGGAASAALLRSDGSARSAPEP